MELKIKILSYLFVSRARWARLGDFDIQSTTDFAQPRDYEIIEHVPHPDYERSKRYNDIALFQLDTAVEFSVFVRPICLNSDPSWNPSPQIATGWGAISTGWLFQVYTVFISDFDDRKPSIFQISVFSAGFIVSTVYQLKSV